MKIKPEDYATLKNAIRPVLKRNVGMRQRYIEANMSETRFVWDLLHVTPFKMLYLYDYLDDNHITTALKAVVKELEKELGGRDKFSSFNSIAK